MDERIGVIGLGVMGGAFARHLAGACWEVIGYDIDAGRNREAKASTMALSNNPAATKVNRIPMSLENKRTGQPNLSKIGEGCQKVPMINGGKASYRSGGVGAGSGVVQESGLSREISRREAATPQPTTQAGQTGKLAGAQGDRR